MKKKINFEEFSKKAAELLKQGKPITGKNGIFTPLIKQIVEAALEGEMDSHIKQTRARESNRRNGHGNFEPQTIQKRQQRNFGIIHR